jgi:hypothetical protein
MNAAAALPPDYAGLEGCAALGGLSTQSSHGLNTRQKTLHLQEWGTGVSCAALPCGFYFGETAAQERAAITIGKTAWRFRLP